jgi:hypothetical protein
VIFAGGGVYFAFDLVETLAHSVVLDGSTAHTSLADRCPPTDAITGGGSAGDFVKV